MSKTILVVDDSMVSRMMIKEIIKGHQPSAKVIEASSGDNALEQLTHESKIDIALIDYNMPGMTGLELFNELKGMINIPKRVLLTANIQDDIKTRTLEAGIVFLNKPISEDVVAPFINS